MSIHTKFYYVLFFFLINNAMMFVQPLLHMCNYDKYDKIMIVKVLNWSLTKHTMDTNFLLNHSGVLGLGWWIQPTNPTQPNQNWHLMLISHRWWVGLSCKILLSLG